MIPNPPGAGAGRRLPSPPPRALLLCCCCCGWSLGGAAGAAACWSARADPGRHRRAQAAWPGPAASRLTRLAYRGLTLSDAWAAACTSSCCTPYPAGRAGSGAGVDVDLLASAGSPCPAPPSVCRKSGTRLGARFIPKACARSRPCWSLVSLTATWAGRMRSAWRPPSPGSAARVDVLGGGGHPGHGGGPGPQRPVDDLADLLAGRVRARGLPPPAAAACWILLMSAPYAAWTVCSSATRSWIWRSVTRVPPSTSRRRRPPWCRRSRSCPRARRSPGRRWRRVGRCASGSRC